MVYKRYVICFYLYIYRDHFSHEGSCQIVNSWSDMIISEGQRVIQYTIVLKFDDQMVANSVKQK